MRPVHRLWLAAVLVLVSACVGCVPATPTRWPSPTPTPTTSPPEAVYLVIGEGWLRADHLAAHPEVAVVHTFAEVKDLAEDGPLGLWLDSGALDLADVDWLKEDPQRWYPLIVVGIRDGLHAFHERLPMGIGGMILPVPAPPMGATAASVEGGYCVWWLRHAEGTAGGGLMAGHDEDPTVVLLLQETRSLLGGR